MADRRSSQQSARRGRKRSKIGNNSEDHGYSSSHSTSQFTPSTSQQAHFSHLAEVGIIEHVSLTNFMCHSKLDFKFGPNITFIIGRNGSGKSAVLTAIVVGLGGKASDTSRGSNMKGFIKNGQSYAQVEVQLRNQGPDAYKAEEYGNSIIVVRRISEVNSTYKLKSSRGNIISTKKEDLLAILEHLNIQVDNPVSVLTQTISRSFLNSKNDKDKYRFFMKATQLDQIRKSNAAAAEEMRVAEDRLRKEQETLPHLKRDMEEWANRFKVIRCMQELQEKCNDLRGEYVWSLIIQKENEGQSVVNELESEQLATKELHAKIQEIAELVKEETENNSNLNSKLQDLIKEMHKLNSNKADIAQEIQKVKEGRRTNEYKNRKATSELKSAEAEEATLQQQIKEIIKSEPQDNSSEKTLRDAQIHEYEEQLKTYQAKIKSKNAHLNTLRGSISHFNEKISEGTFECTNIKRKLESLHRKRLDLEGSRKNKLQRYGQHMPLLLESIEEAWRGGKFFKKPLGPIASLISLREAKWALAIEACLGSILQAFCCDNYKDQLVLKQLMNKTIVNGRIPNTLVGGFQNSQYETTKINCPPHCTILDMLKFDSPVIANVLIDHKGIESILLIQNRTVARNIMTHNVPENCNQCFTIEGDQIFAAPDFRSYTNNRRSANYLEGSVDDKICELNGEQQKLNADLQLTQQKMVETKNNLNHNMQESKQTEAEIKQLYQDYAKVKSNQDTLLNFVEPEPVDVSSLEQEMKNAQDRQTQLTLEIKGLEQAIKETISSLHALEKSMTENDDKKHTLVTESVALKDQIANLNDDIVVKRSAKEVLVSRLTGQQKTVENLKQKWEQIEQEILSMKDKSKECFPIRVETKRSPATIHNEIKKIEESLKQEKRSSFDDVSRAYMKSKTKYKKAQADIADCAEMMEEIKNGVQSRQKRFGILRDEIVIRIKLVFAVNLNSRQFRGKIKFDHKHSTLSFQIQANSKVKEMCKDMKSLSGGERSFATVCFITSLWETMESPFRILDEYDVFMDMVNRKMSMGMMISTAESKPTKQFIFLTPLQLGLSNYGSHITICRMPDPERGLEEENEEE